MKILTLNQYLRQTFGCKVYKLSLQSGCTCPNRDGTVSFGGCTFCSEGGSGDFAASFAPIKEQIQQAKTKVDSKFGKSCDSKNHKYIAYFQSYTNTYGDINKLYSIYTEAIMQEEIVALSIGTRPDCINEQVMDMLIKLNKIKPVWIELGLQTIHEETAIKINRGYTLDVFEKTYHKLKEAGITVIVHVILGLPGESQEQMKDTVRYLSKLNPSLDGIKLQLLHVLEGTLLAKQYKEEPFKIFTMEEYCNLVVECLKILPESTVIHRMTGDGPKRLLIEPQWSGDKKRVMNYLNKLIEIN